MRLRVWLSQTIGDPLAVVMAPTRGITVRLGSVVAHVGSVQEVSDLMIRLNHVGRPLSADSGGEMADVAAGVLQAGVVSSQVLEAETLAKGIAKAGRDLPNSLRRELRQLDAAAALLRHPGAAARLVDKLRQWSGKAIITDDASGADFSESTDATAALRDSTVASVLAEHTSFVLHHGPGDPGQPLGHRARAKPPREDGFPSGKAPTTACGDQSCIEQPSCAPPAWAKVVTQCQCRTSGGRWQKAMISRVDAVAQIVEVMFLEDESTVKLIPFNHFKEPSSLWSLRPR